MEHTQLMRKAIVATWFAVYLYFLIKLILFKWGPVNIDSLYVQLQHTLHHPGIILNGRGNYIPFNEISKDIQRMSISDPFSSTNLVGNIIAFIPFGIFIPMMFRKKGASMKSVFVLSFLLSLCFEVTQLLLFIGTFDVDDLILNTCGGIVGYVAFRIFTILGGSHPRAKRSAFAE